MYVALFVYKKISYPGDNTRAVITSYGDINFRGTYAMYK